MPLGYRGEGVTFSATMCAGTTITKGDVVAFDPTGKLLKAPANEKNPAGVAAETRTSAPNETPRLAFVKHGVAGVRATSAVKAGEALKVGATAGEVVKLPDQAVNEAGVATYTLYRNERLGTALMDIAAGAEGDIFVGA
jgi:hypothetical protein